MVTATDFCFPPRTWSTLRNPGCYQWCTLVMNQHEQHRGAKVLSKSHKKVQGVSPALCSRLRSRGAWLLKAFAQNPHRFWYHSRSREQRGEKGETGKEELDCDYGSEPLCCFSMWFFLIWFLFKEAITFHITTSTLLKCSQSPSN